MSAHLSTRTLAGAPWRRLVALGDRGRDAGPPWPQRLVADLRAGCPDLAFLDLCRPGVSISDTRSRQLARALDFKCDLALVICGAHEGEQNDVDLYGVEVELGRLIGPLRDIGADVMTVVPTVDVRSRVYERISAVSMRHGALHLDLEQVSDAPTSQGSVLRAAIRKLATRVN